MIMRGHLYSTKTKVTEQSITKYNSLSFGTYSLPLHEFIMVFALESKMTYVTLVEWGSRRDHLNPKLYLLAC